MILSSHCHTHNNTHCYLLLTRLNRSSSQLAVFSSPENGNEWRANLKYEFGYVKEFRTSNKGHMNPLFLKFAHNDFNNSKLTSHTLSHN